MNKKIISFTLSLLFCLQISVAQNKYQQAPPVIPYWAFGHWIWEDEKNTRQALEQLVKGYKDNNIPVRAVIIDSPWMNSYTDFNWDETRYPKAQEMIDNLHNQGIRVLPFYTGCLNLTTLLPIPEPKDKNYDFAVQNNFCINENANSKWGKGTGVHIDITNKYAKTWWHTQVDKLHDMKFDGAKIEFGFMWFGDTIKTSIGKMPQREFAYHYFGDAFDYNVSRNDEFVAMTYAWSGVGLMGFPSSSHVNWVGDFNGDWKGIKKQLKNIYLSAGYGFTGIGCEIGGYWNIPSNKEQFIRYAQLGSLCPIMINGGSLGAFKHHLPWNHDIETVNIYRKYVNLHNELAPYLFSTSVDAHLYKSTIIKNENIKQESHMLGDLLFVKVKTDSLPETKIQFPDEGYWIDYWDDDQVYAPGFVIEKNYDLSHYPLFIKSGAILPLQESNEEKIKFQIYPRGISSFTFHKPKDNGVEYEDITIKMDEPGKTLNITSTGENSVIFLIKWPNLPEKVTNSDTWSYDESKKTLRIEKKGTSYKLTIHNK